MRLRGVLLVLLLTYAGGCFGKSVVVHSLRMWRAPDHTRLVFDLSGPLVHKVFTLDNPYRVVVDINDAVLRGRLPELDTSGRFLKGVRTGQPEPNTLRFVFDMRRPVEPRTAVLKPSELYGHRLVIDLYSAGAAASVAVAPVATAPKPTGTFVVAIDAGHGGEDPGAVGPSGVREKDVVLSIAKRLYKLVSASPGFRPVMIRSGDYYVGLRRRIAIARHHNADLFVSIHADAYRKRSARGSSVFTLSQRGASSEMAKWIADKENASDLAGGVTLRDKDEVLAKVLLDLSMTQTINDGISFGSNVLGELAKLGRLHSRRVEQAGFAVLKSPDIPSILVETAFLSNPKEERLLASKGHQIKVASAIFKGIKRYAADVQIASVGSSGPVRSNPTEYVVRSGDTLSHIAQRFNVSVSNLRSVNKLGSSHIKAGQKLRIPTVEQGG